jgi:cytochrome c553
MPRVVIALALAWGCALEAPPDEPVPEVAVEFRLDDRTLLDETEVHHLPPPISGGSLAVSGDVAVAADPDLDRVYVVSLSERRVLGEVRLRSGDEPGRVAIDGGGRAHVALRRSGDVVTIDLASAALLDRVHACAAPRGVAWDAPRDRVMVACADGLLAWYPAAGGPVERVYVADDLRDIVPLGDRFLVSRFRTAEILTVDPRGDVIDRRLPPTMTALSRDTVTEVASEPSVAWRMTPYRGGALVAHQRSSTDALATTVPGGYGSTADCPTAIQSALSFVPETGPIASSAALFAVVLPVDVAADPSGERLAIAAPGTRFVHAENGAPLTVSNGGDDLFALASAEVFEAPDPESGSCANLASALPRESDGGEAVAVAWSDEVGWIGLARAPARLFFGAGSTLAGIDLSPVALADKGHELFHSGTGSGLACASCHPEGGDDGRAWSFTTIGRRRTQSIRGGVLKTAPFHWNGDMPSFDVLLHHVFAQRMNGPRITGSDAAAFARFIDAIPPMPPVEEASEAVERGRALFHSPELLCATCHVTPALGVAVSADVGTGGFFQVPPLAGVAYRAPYLHDGCAATLADRFTDPCAGGDRHGRTSHLSAAEIGDLVSYLRTL